MTTRGKRLRFRIVNVFTTGRTGLTGNPLCVFEDGSGLDAAAMQALALQFNLSETTFILPAAPPDAAAVRIFTPSYEMPFAGHPTLGTAHVCRALGLGGDRLRLSMRAGSVAVEAAGDRWTLTAPEGRCREFAPPRADLAAALGLGTADLGERPLWVKAGKEQLIVPLAGVDAVDRASPRPDGFFRLQSEDGTSMAYVFAADGPGRVRARFFFGQGTSILEDPATGSAAANLGGWSLAMNRPLPIALEISQGALVGRPSTIRLSVRAPRRVEVGGDVVQIGRGEIELR